MVLIFVRKTTGSVVAVDVDVRQPVRALKDTLAVLEGVPQEAQTLIFAGRVLKNESNLLEYNITKECSVQMFASGRKRKPATGDSIEDEPESSASNDSPEQKEKELEDEAQVGGYDQAGMEGARVLVELPDSKSRKQQVIEPVEGASAALNHGDIILVKLVEARDLVKADFWLGSSDPYVVCAVGSSSVKSKVIKRTLNPAWNETFGFRLSGAPGDESTVLKLFVFDFDNFTPDDFIGQAEINLLELPRNTIVDKWVKLERVKSGEVHLQLRRSILTSPPLNKVLTSLMGLERGWTPEDLQQKGVTLQQLAGEAAWLSDDASNPAIDHLIASIKSGSVDWQPDSLQRVAAILGSQNLLPTQGVPTAHLWFSGIAPGSSIKDFVSALQTRAAVKQVKCPTNSCFALVDFRTIGDAVVCFLDMQQQVYRDRRLTIGFGRFISREDALLTTCSHAGFLSAYWSELGAWRHCWIFLSGGILHLFDRLQSDAPLRSLDLSDCLVCRNGARCLEILDVRNSSSGRPQSSVFLEAVIAPEIKQWQNAFKHAQTQSNGDDGGAATVQGGSREDTLYSCEVCKMEYALDEVFLRSKCGVSTNQRNTNDEDRGAVTRYTCMACLRRTIVEQIEAKQCSVLALEFSVRDIRELLAPDEFERYLETSLVELLETDESFVKCPSCSVAVEFVRGDANGQDAPDFQRINGLDNRPLSSIAQEHYVHNRIRCRNSTCNADFCRSCKTRPYHAGFTCEEYEIYKVADHCRFCDRALMPKTKAADAPSPALELVCNSDECLVKRDQCCTATLACGHPCNGVRNEIRHPPCLRDECRLGDVVQDSNDFCNICFTESLGVCPSIQLDCGHYFHYECVKKRLAERWPTPQISFGFSACPLCKMRISHPLLDEDLKPVQALHREIEKKSYERLQYENLTKEPEVVNEGEQFYRNVLAFGMDYFAFYMCFKCKMPYFGGKPQCDDGLDQFDPSELVCGPCSGIGVAECSDHGRDYILFKCRFCCSPSSWFCWGTTHFCDSCHRKQENHDYMTTKPVEELEQCKGPEECPLGVEHPPNGEEFSLGCMLCRGSAPPPG